MSLPTLGRGKALFVLDVTFPGLALKVASFPYASLANGVYAPKVLSWGSIEYNPSDRGGSLSSTETTVEIEDADRLIAREYSGVNADSIRGSVATIKIATPDSSTWRTIFAGGVVKVSFPRPFVAAITMRVKDDQLLRKFPRGWAVGRNNFSNAADSSIGKIAQIVVGTHDVSNYRTGPGALPAILVNKATKQYLCGAGSIGWEDDDLIRCYKNGVAMDHADWTASYSLVSGRWYTLLDIPTAVDADVITFDSKGMGDSTNWIGLTNPAAQLGFILSNFVFADTLQGDPWSDWNAMLDGDSFTRMVDYFDLGGVKGSLCISAPVTGLALIASFCKSFGARAFWTPSGTIGIGRELVDVDPYDFESTAEKIDANIKWDRHEHGSLSLEEQDFQISSRFTVSQARATTDGSYLSSFEITDPSVDDDTQDTLELEWSAME